MYEKIPPGLIDGLLAGKRLAQSQFYELYLDKATLIAKSILLNRDDYMMAVSNAFLKVLTKFERGEVNPEDNPLAYLMKTVRNQCLLILASHKKRQMCIVPEDQIEEKASRFSWYFHHDNDYLFKKLDELPITERQILILFCFEEFSHAEISSILGISTDISRSKLVIARKKLASMIKNDSELQNLLYHDR